MNRNPHRTEVSRIQMGVGLIIIFGLSVALRVWGLGRFNTLVFDEIYYVTFASDYFKGIATFGGHPPVSFYPIAIAIWIAQHTPLGDSEFKNGLAGMLLSPVSYRWLNAVVGAFLPMVVAAIAYLISHRRSYALIAACLIALDGMFLVDSRYALNNNYLILFGLLGHGFLLRGVMLAQGWGRSLSLVAAGVGLGLAFAVKWNGLGFLLGLYLCWIVVKGGQGLKLGMNRRDRPGPWISPLQRLGRLNLADLLLYLGVVPGLTYTLTWIPFMRLEPGKSFWDWQQSVIQYHSQVGGLEAHPYCSAWYSWPILWRPVLYFYQTAHGVNEPPPIVGPSLPASAAAIVYDVHAIANPILLWFSTAAVIWMAGALIQRIWVTIRGGAIARAMAVRFSKTRPRSDRSRTTEQIEQSVAIGLPLYLLLNYAANWLPWAVSSRCTFFYHYMGSMVFAYLALAWLIDRGLHARRFSLRVAGVAVLSLVAIAFIFWLPLYLGLPLSPEALQLRFWLRSWI